MDEHGKDRSLALNEDVLVSFIRATNDHERQCELEKVVERARPLIERIVLRHARSNWDIRAEEREDIASAIMLRLVQKLDSIRLVGEHDIRSLDDYVAILAHNCIYDFTRRRRPERTSLKNRLRYVLGHDSRFAMWTTSAGILCGLEQWRGREDALENMNISVDAATRPMLDRERPGEACAAVLLRAGAPMSLDALTTLMAALWQVVDVRAAPPVEMLTDPQPVHDVRYETRQALVLLWEQIETLRPNQRTALLLNLRDAEGINAVALFVLLGIATFEQIARAMEMGEGELSSLWDRLPLDDLTIASRLGITRQQVINLRKSARERLARRLASLGRIERSH